MLANRARERRAQAIFADIIDLPSAERDAALEQACGADDELRALVEELLAADASGGSFIEATLCGAAQLLGEAADPIDPILRRGTLGKYEILETVGCGGFGKVYKGRDPDLQRTVAIKTCSAGLSAGADPNLQQRFAREARIAAGLQHPNIVTVHDFGFHEGTPFLVQELLTGEDLDRKISRRAALSVTTRIDILRQIARGLAYAHHNGVLHRDIKPSNIRVLESGRAKILDFGIARVLGEHHRLTSEGVAVGTVGYLAPEQLDGETVDGRADIFSFGVLAYELLSYEHPFPGKTFSKISYRLMFSRQEPLIERCPECPAALARLIDRCLEKDSQARYASFDQVVEALDGIVDRDEPPIGPAPPTRPALRAGRPAYHRTLGLAAAALLLIAMGSWQRSTSEVSRPDRAKTEDPPVAEVATVPDLSEAAAHEASTPIDSPLGAVPPSTTLEPKLSSQAEPAAGTTVGTPAEDKTSVQNAAARPRQATPREPAREIDTLAFTEPTGAPQPADRPATPRPAEAFEPGPIEGATVGNPARATQPAADVHPKPAEAQAPPPLETLSRPSNDNDPASHRPLGPLLASTPMRQLVIEPHLTAQPEPRYPSRARRRRIEARVVVAVLVDTAGRVAEARIQSSDDPGLGFDQEALRAAREARFRAGSRDGVAARMWSRLEFDFLLP